MDNFNGLFVRVHKGAPFCQWGEKNKSFFDFLIIEDSGTS